MGASKTDLFLTDDQGEVRLPVDWGQPGPVRVEHAHPDLTSTAIQLARNQPFSIRDVAPPYPVEWINFQGGAGQESYDSEGATYQKFYDSRGVLVDKEGWFRQGPYSWTIAHTDQKPLLVWDGNRLYGAFTPLTSGTNRNQLRHFAISSGDFQSLAADATTIAADATGNARYDLRAGDILFNTANPERLTIVSFAAGVYTVSRQYPDLAHTAGEWVVLEWIPYLTSADTTPTQPVTALAGDGKTTYAAFFDSTPGTNNGDVWKRVVNASGTAVTDWAALNGGSAVNNITALCPCAGYLYAARTNYSGVTTFGTIDTTAGTYTAISSPVVLPVDGTVAAMVASGNTVYALLTFRGRAWVYKIYHNGTAHVVNLLWEIPESMLVPTCLSVYLDVVYVGGYKPVEGYTFSEHTRERALVYAIIAEQAPALLFEREGDLDEDGFVRGIKGHGRFLYIVTANDVYRYDLGEGGWSHYATVPAADPDEPGYLPGTGWFYWFAYDQALPSASSPVWTFSNNGDIVTHEMRTDLEVDDEPYDLDYLFIRADSTSSSNYWGRYLIADANLTAGASLRVSVGGKRAGSYTMGSRVAQLYISNDEYAAVARVQAQYSGDTVTGYKVLMGYWASSDATEASWSTKVTGLSTTGQHVVHLTLGSEGFVLYVDGEEVGRYALSQCIPVDGSSSFPVSTVYFACGWPYANLALGGGSDTDARDEQCHFIDVSYTRSTVGPSGGTGIALTTEASGVDVYDEKLFVASPGVGATMISEDIVPIVWGAGGAEASSDQWLLTAETSCGMGAQIKHFIDIILRLENYDPDDDQTVTASAFVDGALAQSGPLEAHGNLWRLPVRASGSSLAVKVGLKDAMWNRPRDQRLRAGRMTATFIPVPTKPQYRFIINITDQTRGFDGDPGRTIARLQSMASKVVGVRSIYGEFDAYVEKVSFVPVPSDDTYPEQRGRVEVQMREL